MAIRDVLVLNTTASRAETQQSSDTVIIKGNSRQALSVENSSGTSILSVNTVSSSVDVDGKITATNNVSSSLSSTGSFGRVEATTLVGDAFNLSNTEILGTISSSGQIANQISGSFRLGFEFDGTIGSVANHKTTASFDRIVATTFSGSAANLSLTTLPGTISGSAQIASQISGAFTSGFNFDGTIQGIAIGDDFVTNGTFASDSGWTKETGWTITGGKAVATNAGATYTISQTSAQTITANTTYRVTYTMSDFSSSPSGLRIRIGNQLLGTGRASNGTFVEDVTTGGSVANQVIGFYSSGGSNTFKIDNVKFQKVLKGVDSTSTGSFGRLNIDKLTGNVSQMSNLVKSGLVSGSAQLASNISGSFQKGFEFDGHISGSAVTTASFANVFARKAVGNISQMYNIYPKGTVSGSAQLAKEISASFAHTGFEFDGTISGSATSTGSFDNLFAKTIHGDISNMTNILPSETVSGSAQIASRVSGSFNKGFEFSGNIQTAPAAWSAGGTLNTARSQDGGVGTKAAFIQVNDDGKTEIYNGSSWSEVNDMISGKIQQEAAGSSTSALVFGGWTGTWSALSEEWNGTNWSAQVNLPVSRSNHSAAGQTDADSALAFGGSYPPAGAGDTDTVEWNGSSWTTYSETGLAPQHRNGVGFGSTEAALYSIATSFNKEWNGTAWSSIANSLQSHDKGSGGGTVNDGVVFGGSNAGRCTELYDGTSWSQQGALSSARIYTDGGGTSAGNVLAVGAQSAPQNSTAEHFSTFVSTGSFGRIEVTSISGDGSNLTNSALAGTISSSAQIASNISGSFTSGFTVSGDITNTPYTFTETATLNTSRQALGASGIKTAGLVFGGYAHPTQVNSTETFNGSSWSEVNNLNTAGRGIGGSGTSTATVAFGGHPTRNQYTEEWNGTNWSEVNDMIRSDFACQAADIGISSEAAIAAGSCTTGTLGASSVLCNEEWNGTNWATANALIHNASQTGGGAGSANAGITAGGFISPGYPGAHRCTQLWNGTNWSESEAALPPSNHRGILYGWGGSQNDAIITSGCSYQGALFDTSYCYNGISWAAGSAIGTLTGATNAGVYRHKGAGTTVDNSFFAGGIGGGGGGNSSIAATFCTDNGVATASFSRLDALQITGSVDGMTNIDPPAGAISASVQIASSISGSFNKGFEFSGEIRSLGVWSAGGDFPGNAKHTYFGGVWGTQNSALLGGGIGVYQSGVCDTYSYNGTSWSDTGANMIDTKGGYTAHGTENAALAAGGIQYKSHIFQYLRINTEEWNGSAWSKTTNLPHQLAFLNNQKGGTQNASLIAGGYTGTGAANVGSGSEAFQRTNVTWDGLSYTIGASMANERGSGGFVGSVNSGLAQGANNSLGASTCTEEWNGTAWSDTAASNFPTAFTQTVGTSNNAMHTTDFGNSPNKTACTDFYNGVSWSTGPNAPSGDTLELKCAGSAGSTSAGLFMAYGNSCVQHFDENHTTSSIGRVDATELSLESNTDLTVNESLQIPLYATNPPVTSSAGEVWYNTAEEKLYFTYDINSWSEVADLNSPKSFTFGSAGSGTQDALFYGGYAPYPTVTATTEFWNGTTWSEVADLQDDMIKMGGTGCSTDAAIMTGGSANHAETNVWDGSTWTEVNDFNTARGCTSMSGTANAALLAPGVLSGGSGSPTTEEWNGTNWATSTNASLSYGQYDAQMIGTQNDTIKGVGFPQNANAAHYDGTSWASINAYNDDRQSRAGFGTANAAIYAGGRGGSNTGCPHTEEYNGISWKSVSQLGQGRGYGGRAGTQSSGMLSGGNYGSPNVRHCGNTEQYTTTGIGCHCIGGV